MSIVAKVLVVGDYISLIHEDAICSAFEANQLEVESFKFNKYFTSGNALKTKFNNFQIKFTIGPTISKINNDLYNLISSNHYDFVFFYRPRIIQESVLKFISTRSIIYFYNNDDPFSALYNRFFWSKYFKGLKYCKHIFYYRHKNNLDYNKIGYSNVTLLRSYFIKSINFPLAKSKQYDVVFIGHYENDGRDIYLKYLLDNGISLKIYGPEWHRSSYYKYFIQRIGEIKSLNLIDYNIVLNSSKIALVFLSTLNSDTYTRRCFEIPATKAFMLATYTDDLAGLFIPGKEADFFESKEELLNKVNFYLQNSAKREEIAYNGYKKVLSDFHEVSYRVKIILDQFYVDIKK
jgi:hypothetical protein